MTNEIYNIDCECSNLVSSELTDTHKSDYGIENYIDIVNGKTDKIIKAQNYDRFEFEETIKWWKKLATKRYNKLKQENRLRTEMEVWTNDKEMEVIR